jgi:hypothetical protein
MSGVAFAIEVNLPQNVAPAIFGADFTAELHFYVVF